LASVIDRGFSPSSALRPHCLALDDFFFREMPARYLKATPMDSAQRTLPRVALPRKADPTAISGAAEDLARTRALVESLMGRRPELRFDHIQKKYPLRARFGRIAVTCRRHRAC
jgi:hypothetical protein